MPMIVSRPGNKIMIFVWVLTFFFLIVTEETVSLAACQSLTDAEPVQFTTLEKVTVRIMKYIIIPYTCTIAVVLCVLPT